MAEVFLTGRAIRLDDDRFALTGQWPRAHTLFTVGNGDRHHPLLAAETIRQVGLYLAHAEFDVPLGHVFLMHDLEFTVDRERLRIGRTPTDLALEATAEVDRRSPQRTRFHMDITIRRADEDRPLARGGGTFTALAPATYRRMRGERETTDDVVLRDRPTPAAPFLVGRTAPLDVVLSPADRPGRWLLSPDPRNPVLFDHSTDHFPGMVLLEAAYQASHDLFLSLGTEPTAAKAVFHRYAELDEPCTVEAERTPHSVTGDRGVEVTARQGGNPVFTCVLTTPAGADGPAA
ncbi:ScbA/BarX family gamma-butyrolactone biosynthesis protein [Streptomyces macrosporus]|uniref:ScbA/BarX family gamma-butyrolactone biosynthesis protein n=1 Tax=Streptomyces macrosporus TaxID=44032 RepID=UPI003CD08431